MFDRIVVALDGSQRGERVLGPAVELAERMKRPLHLIRVADLTWLRFGVNEAALEYATLGEELADERRDAETYLELIARPLRERGLTVTVEARSGLAARELIAATKPSDLLAMASHGRGGPARWLLGSVVEEVVRHAVCPVLVIRAHD
ncbi:MAG: universal stress protein [Thermomicrobiales bacterium]|nr:universal stress protein [Thermomicrobiales bacterium]